MPPFAFQALLRADARTQEAAQAFLNAASTAADALEGADRVTRYRAVPLAIQRVANVERAQMLIESDVARSASAAAFRLAAAAACAAPKRRGQGRDPLAGRRRPAQHLRAAQGRPTGCLPIST